MLKRRAFLSSLAGGLAIVRLAHVRTAGAAGKVVVFAAASLKNALDDVNAAWKADTGKAAVISYASSSALARQIEQGAPADIFVSADLDWMKYLSDRKLTRPGSEVDLLGNELVLIQPRGAGAKVTIGPHFDVEALLGPDGRLAICEPAVPAGKYARASLKALGVWPEMEGRLAQAENVRAALKFVATGEAAAGIVYRTDANAEPEVTVVGAFPEDTHPPIVYPAGLTAGSTNPDALDFLEYMQSAKAKALFEKQGFTVLAPVISR